MSDDNDVRRSGPEEKTIASGGGNGEPARTGNPDRTIQGLILPRQERRRVDSMQPIEPPPRRARPDSMVPPSGVIATGSSQRRHPESGLLTPTGGSFPGMTSEITGIPWVPGQMPAPGVRIAHYELIRELGTGGMGTVFLARDLKLGRKVAIKILQAQHSELAQRFLVEARATARCHHENIVVIYEVGQVADQPYMVLEYLKGQTLTDLITGGRRLPPARTLELMVPVVRALIAAHEQGIVHRDLKPDNIFVTEAGSIKVLDFGIAKIHEAGQVQDSSGAITVPADQRMFAGDTNLTRPGMIMGTVKYMSPEQWGIGIEIDHRTDIWATGIILFRMLAGRHPLSPLQGNQLVCTAMLDQPMPRLRDMAPDVPAGIADVVDRCLLKVKEHRWANARELLKALEPFVPGRYTTRELQIDESPYAGLTAFQENDAGRFFGRSREILAGVQRVRERPIVAIAGPSGVGKSSFVRAGLVPALKAAGEKWETMVIRPGRNPMAALAALTAPLVGSGAGKVNKDGSSTTLVDDIKEQQDEIGRLMREPGHLGMVLRSRAKRERTKMLLFVDQFEELYTQVTDAKERLAFTTALASAADDAAAPVRVVVSLRSDFLDRVSEDPAFVAEVTQGMFFMSTPSRDGLRDALVQPAEMAGYQFETPMMVDDMLAHLETTPGALPLLQFAASKLWEKRDNVQKLLTHSAYQGMGGIAGALATHADATLAEMPGPMQTLARALFLRLITPDRTRAIVSLSELSELSTGGEIQRLVDQLVSARLLVVQSTGEGGIGSTTIEIVHESLIHSWPALRRWLEETSEDSAFIDSLRIASKQWNTRGRPPGLLWRGSEAEDVKHWAKRGRMGVLNDVQRAFVASVMAEASRAERRKSIITIGVVTGLSLLLVASVAVLLKIRSSERTATRAANEAQAALAQEKAAKEAKEQETRQRILAEIERSKAKAGEETAIGERDLAQEDLAAKNIMLQDALIAANAAKELAEENERKAKKEEERAERGEEEAIERKAEVEFLNKALAQKLNEEQARIKKLEDQIGSPAIEVLP